MKASTDATSRVTTKTSGDSRRTPMSSGTPARVNVWACRRNSTFSWNCSAKKNPAPRATATTATGRWRAMIGPPPVRVVRTTSPAARHALRTHVTFVGLRARRICYDQTESDQREDDQREDDQREDDQREDDQREDDQSAVLQRDEDQREEDQREELRPPGLGSQSSPVQVTPSHLPPDQADKEEVARHQAAGCQGVPCTSISPVR